MINPPDRKAQTVKFSTVTFIILAILGSILFSVFKFELLGGLGLGCSLFGLVSWFHFRKKGMPQKDTSVPVESKMKWFLLGLAIVGIIILLLNAKQNGPPFFSGIAAGLTFTCAVAYVFELLLNWFSGFR